jgi:hypothetical protein
MSEAKIEIKVGEASFSGEGTEKWLSEQLDGCPVPGFWGHGSCSPPEHSRSRLGLVADSNALAFEYS